MGLGATDEPGPNQWRREGGRKLAAMKQQLTHIKIDRFHFLFSCFVLVVQGVSIPRHCYNTLNPHVTTCDRTGYTQTTTYNIFTVMTSLQYFSHNDRQKPSTSYFSFLFLSLHILFIAYLIRSNYVFL